MLSLLGRQLALHDGGSEMCELGKPVSFSCHLKPSKMNSLTRLSELSDDPAVLISRTTLLF